MHVQVVTFGLNGISDEEYQRASQDETETFAALPGLVAKIWLRNADSNIYGAVYLWRDRESHDAYVQGDIFESIKNDPALTDVASQDFEVIKELTKATQPGLTII